MSNELITRIEELEVRVAFQEDLLATLNAGVAETGQQIRAMREELGRVLDALGQMRTALNHDVATEPPPPHY